jgi:murein DD-endopeptidase MepM/ murein hydrolase activator NlpD
MAPAGSVVVAPVNGKVIKLSGYNPKLGAVQGAGGPLGWSVYIQGENGKTYYLTHLGSRSVHVGDRVRLGQRIATVANYHSFGRPDHVHMGVHG